MSAIRFLIVDASPSLHKFITQLLTGYGFEAGCIKCVSDPAAALEAAQDMPPDFLLTDWFAKEPTQGIALHRKLIETSPECRFAMLSMDASNTNRQSAQDAGAIFLLKKPCTAQELRSALGNAMELLAVENAKFDSHFKAHRLALAAAQPPPLPVIKMPKFEAGEQVVYQGRRSTIKHVILRRGELVVQLSGQPGMVLASDVHKA